MVVDEEGKESSAGGLEAGLTGSWLYVQRRQIVQGDHATDACAGIVPFQPQPRIACVVKILDPAQRSRAAAVHVWASLIRRIRHDACTVCDKAVLWRCSCSASLPALPRRSPDAVPASRQRRGIAGLVNHIVLQTTGGQARR